MRKAAQVTCFLGGPWSSCTALTKHCHSHCSRGHTQEAQSNEAACQGDADSGSGLLPSGLFSRLRCYDSVCPERGSFLCVSSASPSFSLALTLALSLCLSSFVCFLFLFPFVFSLVTISHCPSSLRVIPSTPHMSLALTHLSLLIPYHPSAPGERRPFPQGSGYWGLSLLCSQPGIHKAPYSGLGQVSLTHFAGGDPDALEIKHHGQSHRGHW